MVNFRHECTISIGEGFLQPYGTEKHFERRSEKRVRTPEIQSCFWMALLSLQWNITTGSTLLCWDMNFMHNKLLLIVSSSYNPPLQSSVCWGSGICHLGWLLNMKVLGRKFWVCLQPTIVKTSSLVSELPIVIFFITYNPEDPKSKYCGAPVNWRLILHHRLLI